MESFFMPTLGEVKRIIHLADKARRMWGIKRDERAEFGDCLGVSNILAKELKPYHKVKVEGGLFNLGEYQSDHSWVVLSDTKIIVDATIDQFFSELDVDLILEQNGIYCSHSEWDGDWLASRYDTSTP